MLTVIRAFRCLAAGILLPVMHATAADLSPCPASPNCVSSRAAEGDSHYIAPLPISGAPAAALVRLKQALQQEPRTTVIREEGGYLHAEVRSFLFRFVDDVEFLLDADSQVIHVRSASRTGYSDLGVNRRRVERIRHSFEAMP